MCKDGEDKELEIITETMPVIIEKNPTMMVEIAEQVATSCKAIVSKTAVNIKGKKYVKVEGWQTIANAHGCVLSARDVKVADTGFTAVGEVRRVSDGMILATAEGFVGNDERMWGKRDEYAKRAMAQTRAMSRAGRSAFAYVVVMMDANLSTTPAEEVPSEGFNDSPPKQPETPKDKIIKRIIMAENKLAEMTGDHQKDYIGGGLESTRTITLGTKSLSDAAFDMLKMYFEALVAIGKRLNEEAEGK